MDTSERKQLERRLAQLESMHDHWITEIQQLDTLLKSVGFAGGIAAVKATALELVARGYVESINDEEVSEEGIDGNFQ